MDMIKRGLALIFRRRDFGLLMATQFLAQAGDGIVQTALAKFIVIGSQKGFDIESARSPDEILRIALYLFVPYTILSPFLGVVIDRWDRRRLLFLANGLRAAVLVIIGLAGTGGVPEIALFLAFLLTLMSTRIVLATKSAALPATLEGASLMEGNATSQLGGALFQLGGAAVAFIGVAVLPVGPIVVLGAIVYGAGAAVALLIRHAGEVRAKTTFLGELGRVARNIGAGVREVVATPQAGAAISTYFWLRMLWSFSLAVIGFVARDMLGDKDLVIVALTGGAGAVGAVLGFMMAARLTARVRTKGQLVLGAAVVAGGPMMLLGALEMQIALAVVTFFLGLGFFLAKISLDTMVQESLGDDFRGRAFSLYDIAYNLAWVIAAAVLKLTYSRDVQGLLIAGSGAAFLLGMGAIALWYRKAGLLDTKDRPSVASQAP